jgi:NADPH:quinone reductase-like Zn-dependent oxidoreductase
MTGGAYAEFVAIDAASIALRPPTLTVEQGAAVAVVGQTAIQALELAKVGSGSTVLIQGGAGGVGSLAIQIAHKAGAHVITTAQSRHGILCCSWVPIASLTTRVNASTR